ncbi:MAG: molybdopterin-binding protein [Actinomycetaceae bacterium]|nr:molybdopterin-binding protein [Actinomycetaceae bacterium]
MAKKPKADLATLAAHLIVFSDRVAGGTKEDRTTGRATDLLRSAGITQVHVTITPENPQALRQAIAIARRSHTPLPTRLIIVFGGTGFARGNVTPEIVREHIEVEIPGIAEQIRAYGLKNTPLSGLSRSVVGVTSREPGAAIVVASPGSPGGAEDTLAVLLPLLPAIIDQLDEERSGV